jgi:chitosanase
MSCTIGNSYQIKAKDTLFKIADRELGDGDRWHEILHPDGTPFTEAEANNLKIGQEICLPQPSHTNLGGLTPEQKRRAEQFTSIFENDTIVLQYDYAEDIGDGRGFTCGRAGFTTATGDALLVVERYTHTQTVPTNGLAKYLPELQRLAKAEDGNTRTIQGFDTDWKTAAQDPVFRTVQDVIVDEVYYQPSAQHADAVGLKTALARAVLYDTIIQHGDGNDADGLPALLQRTQTQVHGTPKTGIDEKTWLQAFIKIRRIDLLHPANLDTQEEWAQSVDRCDAFSAIATAGNYDLHGPIHIHTPNHDAIVP